MLFDTQWELFQVYPGHTSPPFFFEIVLYSFRQLDLLFVAPWSWTRIFPHDGIYYPWTESIEVNGGLFYVCTGGDVVYVG